MDQSQQLRRSLAHSLVALSGGFIEKPLQVCQVLARRAQQSRSLNSFPRQKSQFNGIGMGDDTHVVDGRVSQLKRNALLRDSLRHRWSAGC